MNLNFNSHNTTSFCNTPRIWVPSTNPISATKPGYFLLFVVLPFLMGLFNQMAQTLILLRFVYCIYENVDNLRMSHFGGNRLGLKLVILANFRRKISTGSTFRFVTSFCKICVYSLDMSKVSLYLKSYVKMTKFTKWGSSGSHMSWNPTSMGYIDTYKNVCTHQIEHTHA